MAPITFPRPSRHLSRGFTLIELVVLLVTLGLLAAIVIPTFAAVLGASAERAGSTGAEAGSQQVRDGLASVAVWVAAAGVVFTPVILLARRARNRRTAVA